jgi:murein DD-endopeptidase MepM/ murein hydrolase activator NlpD
VGEILVEKVEVLADDAVLERLDRADVAARLQPFGLRETRGNMAASTSALLFLHLTLASRGTCAGQTEASHLRSRERGAARQAGSRGHRRRVDRGEVIIVGPPLLGERYLSADACCDATRHKRAALPVNGRIRLSQRFAVDWEQLDAQGRIYAGAREDPASYTIFGRDILAVADARVVSVTDGLPNQRPGKLPTGLPIEEADGNSVVLDLGGGRYGLYAHLERGSISVRAGDTVRKGQVIARVGNSGNTLAPHLHFHVMDSSSPLGSNGLPYATDRFQVVGRSPGTEAFDAAEAAGTPLAITPFVPPREVANALPLDQLLINFASR